MDAEDPQSRLTQMGTVFTHEHQHEVASSSAGVGSSSWHESIIGCVSSLFTTSTLDDMNLAELAE
jgi:hypothetical protein